MAGRLKRGAEARPGSEAAGVREQAA
jgi:hypothetical protein